VADTFNNRVQEFTSNGTFLISIGTMGSGIGQLVYPNGLAVDSSGSIYVADTGNPSGTSNNRVEVFASAFISSQPAGGGGRRPLAM
jgi:DNA-binding beta-propeller fold protein YncE